MASLLVKTYDQSNDNPYIDVMCDKRGYVISVQADNWQWGEGEINSGEFIVIHVPGVPVEYLTALLGAEPGNPMLDKMLQVRAFHLDLDALLKNPPTDYDSLMGYKRVNPKRSDPNVLG